MNEDRTVGEVREYISLTSPHLAVVPFDLLTTFPSKVLEEDGATLKSAGLLNSALMLRLKK